MADLMAPEEEIGARGEVGSLHLRRQVGQRSREVVVSKADRAFARDWRRPRSWLRCAARKFDGPQPVQAQGRGDWSEAGFHETRMVRRVARVRAVDELGEVVPLVGIRVRL